MIKTLDKKKSIVAIIPARGGSKRLPRKNILPLGGKPMIVWTIDAAKKAKVFDKIIVSSDDDEIIDIALKENIYISKRSEDLAGDNASVVEVCASVLEEEKNKNLYYEYFCCLYATSPFRNEKDILNVLNLVTNNNNNFAMAVTKFDFPAHQALFKINDSLVPMCPTLINQNSNDLNEIFIDNGSTYACLTKAFMKEKTFYNSSLKGYFMPRSRSVDIDFAEDYANAIDRFKI